MKRLEGAVPLDPTGFDRVFNFLIRLRGGGVPGAPSPRIPAAPLGLGVRILAAALGISKGANGGVATGMEGGRDPSRPFPLVKAFVSCFRRL